MTIRPPFKFERKTVKQGSIITCYHRFRESEAIAPPKKLLLKAILQK